MNNCSTVFYDLKNAFMIYIHLHPTFRITRAAPGNSSICKNIHLTLILCILAKYIQNVGCNILQQTSDTSNDQKGKRGDVCGEMLVVLNKMLFLKL